MKRLISILGYQSFYIFFQSPLATEYVTSMNVTHFGHHVWLRIDQNDFIITDRRSRPLRLRQKLFEVKLTLLQYTEMTSLSPPILVQHLTVVHRTVTSGQSSSVTDTDFACSTPTEKWWSKISTTEPNDRMVSFL